MTNLFAAGSYLVALAITAAARGAKPPFPRRPRTIAALAIGIAVIDPVIALNVPATAPVWPAIGIAGLVGVGMGGLVAEMTRLDEKE